MSNKKMIREAKDLLNKNKYANIEYQKKKLIYTIRYGNVMRKFSFPLTPKNTQYPIKDLKKQLKQANEINFLIEKGIDK